MFYKSIIDQNGSEAGLESRLQNRSSYKTPPGDCLHKLLVHSVQLYSQRIFAIQALSFLLLGNMGAIDRD